MLLVKLPFEVPSLVCDPVIEGLCEVLQHIPLVVTADPPFDVIFPPADAVVRVIAEAAVVVNEGAIGKVVKVRSFP